jgi:hypothetical protein
VIVREQRWSNEVTDWIGIGLVDGHIIVGSVLATVGGESGVCSRRREL